MKKAAIKIAFIVLLIQGGIVKAQKIYSTNYDYQADIKVFVVSHDYKADLLVYKVDAEYKAVNNKGLWFFVDNDYQADKKVFFTNHDYQADLKIYFVEHSYQAAWKNIEKKHLLY